MSVAMWFAVLRILKLARALPSGGAIEPHILNEPFQGVWADIQAAALRVIAFRSLIWHGLWQRSGCD